MVLWARYEKTREFSNFSIKGVKDRVIAFKIENYLNMKSHVEEPIRIFQKIE